MKARPKLYSLNIDKIKEDLNINLDADNRNIIQNEERPFYLEVSVSESFSAYIPIRSNLPHSYGFVTKRINNNKSGLDYTKAYLVSKKDISNYQKSLKTISTREYRKIKQNQSIISNNFRKFLIEINNKIINYDSLNFDQKRDVDYSSLQYQKDNLRECVNEINLGKI